MSGFLVASQHEAELEVTLLRGEDRRTIATVPVADAIYLAAHPERAFIYLASGDENGTITTIDCDTGEQHTITQVGGWPCFVAIHDDYLITANYGDGTVSAIRLDDGIPAEVTDRLSLPNNPLPGGNPERQDAPHPHCVQVWESDLLVADLGTDIVHRLTLTDGALALQEPFAELPAGSGPRHVEPGAPGELWVTLELNNGLSLITADGVATTPATMQGLDNHVGDIVAFPPSNAVVIANRDVNTLGIFHYAALGIERVAEVDCGGTWPTQLATSGTQLASANRDSNSVTIFDGASFWEAQPQEIQVVKPISIQPAPAWLN